MSLLDSLREHSTLVVDTADIDQIARYQPEDATTNPSLVYKASQKPEYRHLVDDALAYAAWQPEAQRAACFRHKLYVNFGCEILKLVKGRVSTETDARVSFDPAAIIEQALSLIAMYERAGVDRARVLIKVASTWEGIAAAAELEERGIHCNLTLMFSFAQAVACAQAGVTLVSPFVGRIYDYYKRERGVDDIPVEEDPGVLSVTRIYNYYRRYEYPTSVMAASFRKREQILALAGCDFLTCSPDLLSELEQREGEVERRLSPERAKLEKPTYLQLDEPTFRWMFNQDAMAVEKLAEGLRLFDEDAQRLEEFRRPKAA